MKPENKKAVEILDLIIPKIQNFVKKSYSELQIILSNVKDGDYLFDRLKGKKKEFASWFVNLDDENQATVINLLGINLSEPEKQIKKPTDNPAQILAYYSVVAKNRWTYQPVEYVLLIGFLVWSLNNSTLHRLNLKSEYSKPLIDFKGWANYWDFCVKKSLQERYELADYIVNQYCFS